MNYTVWADEPIPTKLHSFDSPIEFRPHTGDIMQVRINQPWKITRTEPTSNPDNVTVKYFVRPFSETPPPNASNLEIS